ncbi:putative protein kinase [Leptomonas pyrrhocoris]|uniref:non-specific serine/threonine protein kinase n=1 Tax=Leptomonas pyrrhocoris TaxID=157538 RepID=A0A0N0DRM6_LEPPY|nr:putative protein kinase [Leptomonas pyrrhocoris]KPA74714.1 putative protein kinase [Leptomonas pyrrhocoris]|eukprot:XP_015653153.1 putative protein kinase [Leptomonas pyrrhocoris]
MLGAGGRRPHGGVACWANMSIPLAARPPPLLTDRPRVWPVADLLAPDGVEAETQTDKAADAAPASKDERDGVFSYIDFALVPARRDAVVALWPSPSSSDDDDDGAATVSFYLFGGRSPPLSRSDRGAAATEVFKATFYACSESGTPQEDADVSAASPKLLGLSYTRVIHPRQHEETATSGMAGQVNTAPADSISTAERIQMTPAAAADAAAIPNNNGSTCVAVNGYTPLWYNISFSVLLSHVETERACPGISQSSDAPASFSACSLMLSASPQCDEPIVELRHLSPRNARVVTVPVHNEVGDVTGTQRAFAVAQTLLIGSLEHGLMRVMAAGEEGRSIGSSIRNASDNYNGTLWKTVAYRPVRLRAASRQVHRQRSPSHDDQDGDVPQSGHLLYYPQDFVHVCLSLRPGVIASCGASHQRRRSELFSASLTTTTTTTTTIKTVPKADGNGTREVKADRYRAAACSTRFYETLSPHQPFVLSPELPCCSEKDSSSGGSGRGGDDDDASPLIPTPHRLLRSWMLLTTLIVLLVMIVGYIVVTFVVMPGYVRHRTRRHDVAFMDTPDPDQQRSLVPYREARIFLGVDGGFGAGGTVGFAGGAGGIAGGECNYMDDDLPEEYETALNAAGVGGGGLAGFGAAWDSAVIATPPQQRRRLLDGKYEVIRKLGKGSFSVVYLVRRITDNTTYALKYVQCSDDVDRHEAMKECEVVYALQGHPNVIQLFDMFMSYRFDRHMVTVPRSRRSRGAADTVRVTGEKEKQKTSKKEGGGNPQQPQQEEAARSAGVDEEAGAEANAAGNRGNSPCLLPSPPSASSATTITSTTPRAEASPHDASTAAATEAAARGNSIDNSKPTLRCERQGREYSRSAATNDNAERTGFTSAVGPVVVAAAQQSSLHGAFSSTSTFAETSATSLPVVHLDSTYFDAVTAGVLRDDNTESSTTPPPQRQQQQRTESATAADTQAATDAVAPHHHHHRGLSSLQAERYLSLVMAYHERGDLARWVRQRRALQPFIPEATVVSIAFQVLSLLSYMHHRHQPPIIHRDLKPENILLSTHVHYENVNEDFLPIVVTDFGLSRVMDKTFCETGVGSLPYVAPECWQRRYSAKVDIWALGCVLYAVCAKRVDSSNVKVMFSECAQPDFHAQLRHELESIYGYSDALAWFITALLAVKPDDRPSAVEALGMLRRHPTNEEGEPLFQRAPLAALLRAAPPQQPEEQEENDGGVRSGVVDLVDHASQQSSPYQRRATTREGPAPLPAMHVASARPASFVSTPTPSDWEAANAAPVEDAEAAVPFASAVSQTPQQQPQRQRNHQRECESDSTGFLAATARAHEGQPTDGPRKAPQQESEEDKSGEGVRSAVVVVSSLSLSGPPSTRVASTQPPHSAQRTQWRSADDHPEDEEQGKEDAL